MLFCRKAILSRIYALFSVLFTNLKKGQWCTINDKMRYDSFFFSFLSAFFYYKYYFTKRVISKTIQFFLYDVIPNTSKLIEAYDNRKWFICAHFGSLKPPCNKEVSGRKISVKIRYCNQKSTRGSIFVISKLVLSRCKLRNSVQ